MLLKSLELHGFKTFPDKTKLTFEDGISAVVGPNGSGKSNISDAMRWVLGEQSAKALRCVKMEDVVFSGTPSRKAQGFAEVTLTIDNKSRRLPFDEDTVAITRRYYRSGDSEYLINKATVRLRDIHELFMDTGLGRDGYSMIGQGKIDSVISAKSEERREIFEEAAGISRYRYRKEEAERKLQRAEENLLRLQDILQELEGRVAPLKEQSEKAKLYLELYEEKKQLEIGLWLCTLNQSGVILQEHETKLAEVRSRHEGVMTQSEALDREIEALFQQTNLCLAKAEQARNNAAKNESEATAKEGEISVLQNDIHHNLETIGRLTAEQTRYGDHAAEQREALQTKQAQITEFDEAIAAQKRECTEAEQQLFFLRMQLEESGTEAEQHRNRLEEWSAESEQLRLRMTQFDSTAQEISLRLSAVDAAVAQYQGQLADLDGQLTRQRQVTDGATAQEQQLQQQLNQTEQALSQAVRQMDEEKIRRDQVYLDLQETRRRVKLLEDLERNLEGFAHSVKTVMRLAEQGQITGIHGPVSRLLTVPKDYALAIETALGAAAQNIVVSNEEDAKTAIRVLKQKDGGRATFLPMSTIRGKTLTEPGLRDCKGFVGVAGDLCQCDKQYQGILQSFLGRIAVANTLDDAVAIAKRFRYQFRVVTLDGQVVNAGGSMTGGSSNKKSGLLSRASEIAALKEKGAALEGRFAQTQRAFEEQSQSIQGLRGSLEQLRQNWTSQGEQVLAESSALHRLESERNAVQQQLTSLESETENARRRCTDLETERQTVQEQLRRLEEQMAEERQILAALSTSQDGAQKEWNWIQSQLQAQRLKLLTVEKDREMLAQNVKELEEQLVQGQEQSRHISAELEDTKEKNARLEEAIALGKEEAATLRAQAEAFRSEAEQLQQERMTLEQTSVALRNQEKEASAQKEAIGRELSRLEERKLSLQRQYDEIIEQLWNEYELTRREAEEEAQPVEDQEQSTRRLRELKSKLKGLGSVNLDAIEEYQAVSERYEFLTEQVKDVEQSRTQLHKLIRDLTRQMTEIFKERFQEINEYFKTTFTELFGGGKAHLELSDPEDVLHSGIVILAQPPGKIVKNLELLSGGEKALVAVSLYFSIMKVSPPPFCMLDEIEAALDDVNVVRFAEYLRKMNENTQFIVITHRRGTMEEADVLYGVTMQEEGVSKLLKLDPKQVGKELGVQ